MYVEVVSVIIFGSRSTLTRNRGRRYHQQGMEVITGAAMAIA
jgi:hypothetical protein